jgi:hypothetical protein
MQFRCSKRYGPARRQFGLDRSKYETPRYYGTTDRDLRLNRPKQPRCWRRAVKIRNYFNSVFVAPYDDSASPNAKTILGEFRKRARSPSPSSLTADNFRKAWAYQFAGQVKPGSWLIDLDCKNPTKPHVWGCSRVTDLRLKVPEEYDLTITLRQPVHLTGMSRQLRLSSSEKKELIANSQRILKYPAKDIVPLTKAIRIIDSRRRPSKRQTMRPTALASTSGNRAGSFPTARSPRSRPRPRCGDG